MTLDIKAEIKNRWPQIKDLIWTGVKVWIALPLFYLSIFWHTTFLCTVIRRMGMLNSGCWCKLRCF